LVALAVRELNKKLPGKLIVGGVISLFFRTILIYPLQLKMCVCLQIRIQPVKPFSKQKKSLWVST
ncbi:MAG TPA: hypothetical protein VHT72_01630, partial [Puia sp.]|nr:hypothetical protein [Puia sp.]